MDDKQVPRILLASMLALRFAVEEPKVPQHRNTNPQCIMDLFLIWLTRFNRLYFPSANTFSHSHASWSRLRVKMARYLPYGAVVPPPSRNAPKVGVLVLPPSTRATIPGLRQQIEWKDRGFQRPRTIGFTPANISLSTKGSPEMQGPVAAAVLMPGTAQRDPYFEQEEESGGGRG